MKAFFVVFILCLLVDAFIIGERVGKDKANTFVRANLPPALKEVLSDYDCTLRPKAQP